MALTVVNTPSFAGDQRVGKYDNEYLPMQVFQKPIWDDIIWYQAHKWYLQSLILKVGGEMAPQAGNTIYWTEMGKLYHKEVLSVAGVDNGGGSFTFEYTAASDYYLVNDVIDTGFAYASGVGRNWHAVVTAVGVNGADRTITVQMIDPQGIGFPAATDFPIGQELTLKYNRVGECWVIPEGRQNNPEQFSANLAKITNTYKACDDASNQQMWFKSSKSGRHYWVDEEEYNTMCLHRMHVDSYYLFGEMETFTDGTYSGVTGSGLIPLISQGGYNATFAGNVLEADIIDMITNLGIYSSTSGVAEWEVLCGPQFFRDLQLQMRDYHTGGGVFYGAFNKSKKEGVGNTIGINVQKYQFGNRCINLMEYEGFSDPDFLPQNANGTNYRNFALFLNLKRGGIKVAYKKRRQGGKMKDWLSLQKGPTFNGNGEQITTDQACMVTNYFTHSALQVKGLNDHGILAGV